MTEIDKMEEQSKILDLSKNIISELAKIIPGNLTKPQVAAILTLYMEIYQA